MMTFLFPAPALGSLTSLTFAFGRTDVFGKSIILVLFLGSIIAWSVMVSKIAELRRAAWLAKRFQAAYDKDSHPAGFFWRKQRVPDNPLFNIYVAAFRAIDGLESSAPFAAGPHPGATPPVLHLSDRDIEAMRKAAERETADQMLMLESGMAILATSVTAAPFLGLLGTVWGVLDAFASMVIHANAAMLSAVAPGISGALLTTVVGLFVALPSAVGYNLLVSRIKHMCVEMDNFADELISDLQQQAQRS